MSWKRINKSDRKKEAELHRTLKTLQPWDGFKYYASMMAERVNNSLYASFLTDGKKSKKKVMTLD